MQGTLVNKDLGYNGFYQEGLITTHTILQGTYSNITIVHSNKY